MAKKWTRRIQRSAVEPKSFTREEAEAAIDRVVLERLRRRARRARAVLNKRLLG